jgi:hypothetical protein
VATGAAGSASIAGARAGATEELPGREPGTGRRWMTMRGPELAIGDDFVARFLGDSRPIEVTPRSGRVDPAGGGRSVIRDRVTSISVSRDGTAHFHDKPDVEVHWDVHLPTPSEIIREARQAGRDISEWYADPYKLARVGPAQDVPSHMLAVPGACDHWEDACSVELRQRDRPDDEDRGNGLAHGKLELTDLLMRRFVGDPYASRKLKLLDRTRAERAEAGAAHALEDLARSAELMQRNLQTLWRSTSDPAARRRALFTLWDECTEGEGAAGEAGQRARLIVIGWIRARLPAGSPEAFTAEEIAALAAHRSSKQPFAPYE